MTSSRAEGKGQKSEVTMALSAGARLGPYEVLSAIGAGGMGEVYKARDTRLDRIVAIKVLPQEWASDATMKERFEREAKTIASLKHPHICVLHDVGSVPAHEVGLTPSVGTVDFLVMEYLEGETLTERLTRGPLPLEEALGVAIAIGDALDKAHRQGVVHRDLKPSNVMLTASGPKLLDFGLAKSNAPLPAASTSMTMPGTILGTMQYMAPEQLEGVEADRRTDIFAFGVVMHEMVTGKKAFEGKSQVLLISAIATTEPPALSRVQPETPPALDYVVKTCLEKDPADRWQDARDLVAELRWISEGGSEGDLASASRGGGRGLRAWLRRTALGAAAMAILLLAWPATLYLQGPPDPPEVRFRVPRNLTAQPDETQTGNSASGGAATFSRSDSAISPDGRLVAFVARLTPTDTNLLYVRPVGAVAPQHLAGTDDASLPFWSPESRSIAFLTKGGKLKKVPAAGGPPQELCEAPGFTGGTWNSAGTILFGSPTGVYQVSAEGGKPQAITTVGPSETGHFWPRFLPDGRHFLFLVKSAQSSTSGIYVASLDSKDRTRVLPLDFNAVYSDPGYLVFQRESAVYAQPFNAKGLALTGEPVRIADQVTFDSATGQGHFDVSRNGVLIYYSNSTNVGAGGEDSWEFQLQWTDRGAQPIGPVGPYGFYRGVEVSPDGKRVAVHRHDGTGGDIWVMEPPPRAPTRITFDATEDNSSPVWSPNGAQIVFSSHRNGKWGLYVTQSDGSGTDGELLLESELPKAPMSWSPDGKRLVYWVQNPKTLGDLWILPFDGDKKPVPFLASTKNETHAQISPDGKWIAYTSELTGRKEVYVQPFPSGTGRWQISPDAGLGGDWPRWKHDSQVLYYHSLGNAGAYGAYTNGAAFIGPILEASIKATGASIEAGTPKEVVRFLALRFAHPGGDYHTYDVSQDGQRFLMFQRVLTTGTSGAQITPEVPIQGLTVAMHWVEGLKNKKK
jgi:Tol biopolymer transport system component